MNEWITIQDLIDEYGEYDLPKKIVNDEEVINEVKVNESITSARLKIESYLRKSGISLDPVSESTKLELRECIYNITRYFYSDNDGSMTEEIRARYETCIQYLKDIASGKVTLSSNADSAGFTFIPILRG